MADNQVSAFEATAAKLFESIGVFAKDVALLNGRTFNATFTGERAAQKGAVAISSVLQNVRVAPGFDIMQTPVGLRRETKVWRVHGTLA
jgi:hypothetical protein